MSIYGTGKCDTCGYWGGERASEDDMPLGTCRAKSPTMTKPQVLTYHDPDRPHVAGPLVQRGEWPWTAIDDWCGTHVPRPDVH